MLCLSLSSEPSPVGLYALERWHPENPAQPSGYALTRARERDASLPFLNSLSPHAELRTEFLVGTPMVPEAPGYFSQEPLLSYTHLPPMFVPFILGPKISVYLLSLLNIFLLHSSLHFILPRSA